VESSQSGDIISTEQKKQQALGADYIFHNYSSTESARKVFAPLFV
jgi:hypothetical protein